MSAAAKHRRPAFPHRPWIRGKVYDDFARPSIMHCDAYLWQAEGFKYVEIWWTEGGTRFMAHDLYVVEDDGLTPMWNAADNPRAIYWTWENHAWMRRIHKTVLAQGDRMLGIGRGRWARVVTQAHYIHVTDRDCEPTRNSYNPPKPYAPRAGSTSHELGETFAKVPTLGKRRGRPPGSKNKPKVEEPETLRVVPDPSDPFKGIKL